MRRALMVATRHRRRGLVLFGDTATPSYALSTLTAASATGTADGSTTNALTLTEYLSNGSLATGRNITFTTELTAISASQTTLETDADSIDETTGLATITAYIKDANGLALPGVAAAALSLTSSGSNNTITAVDSLSDRYGRFRWTFSSTSAAAKTLTLVGDGTTITDTVAVTVTAAGGSLPTMDWFSDYSIGGTGTTATAYQDGAAGGKWPGVVSNAGGLEVIASTGLDFASANVLKVTAIETPGSGFHRARKSDLTIPAEGASMWIRFKMRLMWDYEAALGDNSNHPIEAPDTGDGEEWALVTQNMSAGVWRPRWRSMSDEDSFSGPNAAATTYFEGPDLAVGTTYRFELQIARLTGDEFNFHARIYNTSNVLIASDADFNYANLTGTLADVPTLHFASGATAANLAGIGNGLNGVLGSVWHPSRLFAYQGEFAVSRDTWCGAYDAVNG